MTPEERAEKIDIELVQISPRHDASDLAREYLENQVREIIAEERERIKGLIADRRIFTESSAVDAVCTELMKAIDGENVAPCRVCEARAGREG